MKILSVIGTRPQYIKLAPIFHKFSLEKIEHQYIDTGQHYSKVLSDDLLNELDLPQPIVNLRTGSKDANLQIASIIESLNPILNEVKPNFVLVYGDTNSTLGAAIAVKKLGIPLGHIEAGLRSFNNQMPEEINRILTDHCATRLYAPTRTAMENLNHENLSNRALLTGDIMVEQLRKYSHEISVEPSADVSYLVATLHRQENIQSDKRVVSIFRQFAYIPMEVRVFAHPRLKQKIIDLDLKLAANIKILDAQPHRILIKELVRSKGLITDSGGLQKEAYILGKLCTTLRNEIEWVETLEDNWNVLCKELNLLPTLALREQPYKPPVAHYGEGKTSETILKDILQWI